LNVQEDPRQRRNLRRQAARRRRARAWIILTVCLGVLIVGGVSAFAWTRARPAATDTTSLAASSSPSTSDPVSAVSATLAPAEPAATGTASSPDPPAAVPASATGAPRDVSKAAVQFPDAPAVKPNSVSQLKPKHKYVAITLDDGFGFQPEMLALLQQYNAHCTTFVLGSWADANTATLKKLDAAGFEIANHTWDHKTLTKLTDAQVESELLRTQKVISAVTGNQAPLMRPPGGATNARVKGVSASLGYTQVMWNRSFGDSGRGATTKKLYENVVTSNGGIKPGDIILCHWSSKPTYEAMKVILPELKAQGYEFVTVSELIADSQRGGTASKK